MRRARVTEPNALNLSKQERIDRRRFLATATSVGAALAWGDPNVSRSRVAADERRDLYPEGVASGDPDATSVMLWTRRPFSSGPGTSARLRVEISVDPAFSQVIARTFARVSAAADWTCRVLVGNLKPAQLYWYRFIDRDGHASRVGRTRTAPSDVDTRRVNFAFVSCQNANLGAQNAYRRMIFEDDRAAPTEQVEFVLHLGDFIYETVWYPEDAPHGRSGRSVRDIVRYPNGEKIDDFHIPTTVEDYRAIYRAYLHDPDLQDARARWPFVPMWDNHEFSRSGWQSLQVFGGKTRPTQTRKMAANQAWFEYQAARIHKYSGPSLDRFDAPAVQDAPIEKFDDQGLGQEPNNLLALDSLRGYRSLRWGRAVELIITDQRSYRSETASARPEAKPLWDPHFPRCIPEEVLEILDAGRAYGRGKPPETLRAGSLDIPNFRKDQAPQTILGAPQKDWFLEQLMRSSATWKIWGNTTATLDKRTDPLNLPPGMTVPWHGAGYAVVDDGDHGSTFVERAEIYAHVRREKITGFVTVAGDRHSFWAGLAAPRLPPREFEPVGVAFVTASLSAPNAADLTEDGVRKDHPLRRLYLNSRAGETWPEPTINILLKHGVRSCLEYLNSGDMTRARSLSNPQLAPHLKFLDFEAHGYSIVRASSDALECEFVCLPRPLERSSGPDGGALLYRVRHRVPAWSAGQTPQIEQQVVEGNPQLSL